jgi:autotransporter translocation and assembly factor TamB
MLKGDLKVRRSAPAPKDWPLTGHVSLHTDKLEFVPALVKDVDRLTGVLDAAFDVTGTVAAPELTGSATLSDATMDFYRTNLRLRGVRIYVILDERGLGLLR